MIDPGTDTDGDGVPDLTDLDDDNDGITDVLEGDRLVDTDGDGTPDSIDLDSDNDGLSDVIEAGHGEPSSGGRLECVDGSGDDGFCDAVQDIDGFTPVDTDGDLIADFRDLDSDDDGLFDAVEAGHDEESDGGVLTCATTGDDGFCDAVQDDTTFVPADSDDDDTPDYLDLDSDNDGTSDLVEGGTGCEDADGDDRCDGPDTDGDGIVDFLDNLDGHGAGQNFPPLDSDGDGIPDFQQGVRSILVAGGQAACTTAGSNLSSVWMLALLFLIGRPSPTRVSSSSSINAIKTPGDSPGVFSFRRTPNVNRTKTIRSFDASI